MGFFLCKIELDIWIRESDNYNEYITICIDDLLITSKNPKGIINTLPNKHKFKLKRTSSIEYHLRYDFYHNSNNILYFTPNKHIEKDDRLLFSHIWF